MLLSITLVTTRCGNDIKLDLASQIHIKKPINIHIDDEIELSTRANLYKNLISAEMDSHGFILTDTCDSLFFTGLLSAAVPSYNIDIVAARTDNQWFRRPGKDCGPSFSNSRSTISRDMILGLYWHIWAHQDRRLAEELYASIKDSNYILEGEGTLGELYVLPDYVYMLSKMITSMGGPNEFGDLSLPQVFSKEDGYVSHLTVWSIVLKGKVRGYIFDNEYRELERIYLTNTSNPLYSAAYHKYSDGDLSEARSLLLDTKFWPDDRLPDNRNYCTDWLTLTDYKDRDRLPCDKVAGNGHKKGFELVVIYELIIKDR